MPISFYNTLTRSEQTFTPQKGNEVSLYTCGPTVYDYPHVGNWASNIRWDILVRVLTAYGYKVNRVMNITDVGHLVSDADEGQDKLEKGAQREGKTAWEVAEFYTNDFLAGMQQLNLIAPTHLVRATDYISQQLELARTLKQKGFTYQIDDGIYFDTSKFSTYGKFAQLDLEEQKAGARVEYNPQKHAPSDFAIWKSSPPGEHRDMEWETPADIMENQQPRPGFPGWHLECSAIAMSLLGGTLDMHTGGIDHIPVHHTNEIAQSEAATGKQFANFWLHANFLTVNGTKISKSLQNGFTLQDIQAKGFSAMDFRMLVLQSHYRTEANFTWEALEAAHTRLLHWRNVAELRHQIHSTLESDEAKPSLAIIRSLIETLSHDLDTPEALSSVDHMLSELESGELTQLSAEAMREVFEKIDELLGLQLIISSPDISDDEKHAILERERCREQGDYKRSDMIRDVLLRRGIGLRDSLEGTIWYRTA